MHIHRSLVLTIAFGLALLAAVPDALAEQLDVPGLWYMTQPDMIPGERGPYPSLASQVEWDSVRTSLHANFMSASLLLAGLSLKSYERGRRARAVEKLGLREIEYISEKAIADITVAGDTVEIGTQPHQAIFGGSSVGAMIATADGLVAENFAGTVNFVAIRGTKDFDDYLLDINTPSVSVDGILYQHGFYIYSSLLYGPIREALGECKKPIWITGHSLGGASAQILAFWLEKAGCNVAGVFTFGAPASGRTNFAEAYNDADLGKVTHRFVNTQDPTPCLPLGPRWGRVGYQHVVQGVGGLGFAERIDLDSKADLCTGVDDGYAAAAYGYFVMAHDALDIPTPVVEWFKSGLETAGLCDDNASARRVLIGIATGFGSELTCKTIDDFSDTRATADQVLRLGQILLGHKDFTTHAMYNYFARLADWGLKSSAAPFCAANRREAVSALLSSYLPDTKEHKSMVPVTRCGP